MCLTQRAHPMNDVVAVQEGHRAGHLKRSHCNGAVVRASLGGIPTCAKPALHHSVLHNSCKDSAQWQEAGGLPNAGPPGQNKRGGASAPSRRVCSPAMSWLVLGSLTTACCLNEASAQCCCLLWPLCTTATSQP